jgi:hypothetical protein
MLDALPHELLVLVLCDLDARGVCRVASTCRELAAVASCDAVWRHLLVRDWAPRVNVPGRSCNETYSRLVTRVRVGSVGSNEGPDDWGVATQPADMGGGQLGRPEAGFLALRGVARVACGGCHSFFVDFVGRAYACGANSFGQLGLGDRISRGTPQVVPLPCAVGLVACGYAFSFVVARSGDGSVWSCGFAKNGRCAIDDESIENTSEDGHPLLLSFRRCVVFDRLAQPLQLACGSGHGLCLTRGGAVWSWGRNDRGQCGVAHRLAEVQEAFEVGVGNVRGSHQPCLVLRDDRVTTVAAGAYHSCAAGPESGLLLTWGANFNGQCCSLRSATTVSLPFSWPGLPLFSCLQLSSSTVAWLPDERAFFVNGMRQPFSRFDVAHIALPFALVDDSGRAHEAMPTMLNWLGRVLHMQTSHVHALVLCEEDAEV